jgi:DNA invertase Pin-like site-specific DNA recombinase/peptidoglycan hydrolase-like protein with peptidoglycan-binding domain
MHHLRSALGLVLALLILPVPAEGANSRSAGWHGREIRDPYPRLTSDTTTTPRFPHGWSAGTVRVGTGAIRPSARVRELQRRLLRRGYRPGPADGRFGPRTRAAVVWFQIKHGLPRTGRGDAATITRLRDDRRPARPRTSAPVHTAAVIVPPAAIEPDDTFAVILLVVVILIGLALIAAWVRSALRETPAERPALPANPAPPTRDEPIPPPDEPRTVLGYVALDEGEELDAAAHGIGVWCELRGWPLAKVVHDVPPARGRPGLQHALDEIRAGHAAGVVVRRLRDLAGSPTELGPLLQWFVEADAFVIALDYELDTSSRTGELTAKALVEISHWERGRLEGRTRPGLDAARRGAASGAAVRDDPALSARIAAMRGEGMSLQAIADALNEAGVPTLRGGARWRPSSVQAATGYKRPPAKPRGVDLPRLRDDED